MSDDTKGAGAGPPTDAPEPKADSPASILSRGAGKWVGEETMPPAPWAPDGLEAVGRISGRTVFGGVGLVSDYVQEVGGEASMESHTVIRWDEGADRFVMHFFSGPGAPTVLEGRREGDTLVFEGEGATGPMRQTFRYGEGVMEVDSEVPDPSGEGWTTVFEGRYRPVGPVHGSVTWRDLTVDDAPGVRDFYQAVVGWAYQEISMGEYADYAMTDASGDVVAGVCHARGSNADLPGSWLVYITVEDMDAALEAVEGNGGRVVVPARSMGGGSIAVVEDPAGAVVALYQV